MPVPYTFGTATTSIPLSNLDANFNTPVTIGNTTVGLGNTVTTVGNLTLSNATISSGNVTVTSASLSGNLTFTGTGNRITGDFSNATQSNRVAFQTSTANSATSVSVLPNGTSTTAVLRTFNNSDPTNAAEISIFASSSTNALISGITGTGTYLPLTMLTGGSERLRIDTSGNVGIGQTSPSCRLDVNRGSAGLLANFTDGVNTNFQIETSSLVAFVGPSAGSTSMAFITGNIERMRIDSSGNVLIGTTSTGPVNANAITIEPANSRIRIAHASTSNGTPYIQFDYNGSAIGSVTQATTATVAYNTSSDYRLKENITPMTGALAKVAQLKPVTYSWKVDGSDGQGFIAHELQEIAPYAVTGEKDGEQMQGVDYGKITPLLTAALQEALAKIELLEARLAVLESK
jgi:hypothetical protein